MKVDISFLPAYAAAFMLVFARIGTMVMLAAVLLPLHRTAYEVDLTTFGPVLTMLAQEIFIGLVLGITARLMISALQVAGFVIAQQLGLGFVTAVDPTQGGQQSVLLGNFLTLLGITLIFATDLHHLIIAALNDSYRLFKPGEMPVIGDVAALTTQTIGLAFKIGIQLAAPFLIFGLLFNLGLGVLSRLMPQMQVFFVGMPLSILVGLIILLLVLGAIMMVFLGSMETILRQLAPYS
jgi:flagellar biosynthetic protein FliR